MQAIREALDYNTQLEQLACQEGMPKGIAKTNIYGTKFAEGESKDLREIFRSAFLPGLHRLSLYTS